MTVWEIMLIGVALSIDAFAAGMSDAMIEPRMGRRKGFLIALTFGAFQFLMPVLGYYCGYNFSSLVEKIAPYLSFVLLLFIGGKAVLDFLSGKEPPCAYLSREGRGKISFGKILLQGVATSMDALAVGLTFLAVDVTGGLPSSVFLCSLLIGVTTLTLSTAAVGLGRAVGEKFSQRAQYWGGAVLVVIGLKILLEGVL